MRLGSAGGRRSGLTPDVTAGFSVAAGTSDLSRQAPPLSLVSFAKLMAMQAAFAAQRSEHWAALSARIPA